MAKNEHKEYTDKDKRDYYAKRVNDKSLSEGQRNFASKRLESLTSSKSKTSDNKQKATRKYDNGNKGKAQSFTVTVRPWNNN